VESGFCQFQTNRFLSGWGREVSASFRRRDFS